MGLNCVVRISVQYPVHIVLCPIQIIYARVCVCHRNFPRNDEAVKSYRRPPRAQCYDYNISGGPADTHSSVIYCTGAVCVGQQHHRGTVTGNHIRTMSGALTPGALRYNRTEIACFGVDEIVVLTKRYCSRQ